MHPYGFLDLTCFYNGLTETGGKVPVVKWNKKSRRKKERSPYIPDPHHKPTINPMSHDNVKS